MHRSRPTTKHERVASSGSVTGKTAYLRSATLYWAGLTCFDLESMVTRVACNEIRSRSWMHAGCGPTGSNLRIWKRVVGRQCFWFTDFRTTPGPGATKYQRFPPQAIGDALGYRLVATSRLSAS